MMFYKVLLAIGPDKPGIVNTVTSFISERGCNILDSRMSVMGEDFALVLLFSGPLNAIEKVRADIKAMESSTGLTTLLKDTKSPTGAQKVASLPYKLEAFGMDHPGIVNEVTSVLHKHKINVENLETGVSNAPVSGATVFHMQMKISIPASISVLKLKEEFVVVESKANVNITLSPAEI